MNQLTFKQRTFLVRLIAEKDWDDHEDIRARLRSLPESSAKINWEDGTWLLDRLKHLKHRRYPDPLVTYRAARNC